MAFDTSQPNYVDLRNIIAERTQRFVAWVGSGLSASASLPTWPALRENLTEHAVSGLSTLSDAAARKRQIALDQLSTETNHWKAFGILKRALGNTTFRIEICRNLQLTDEVEIPEIYRRIWRLNFSACLTTNLDRLAARGYVAEYPQRVPTVFRGKESNKFMHLLQRPDVFIANLHGDIEDPSSWVFTDRDLDNLYSAAGYKKFLESCIASRVTVFLGISADDAAVGGHFEKMRSLGISLGDHFWITNRNDPQTVDWIEKFGIRRIHYNVLGKSHEELTQLFDDLQAYQPQDETPIVVSPTTLPTSKPAEYLPPLEEVQKLPSPNIRNLLNYEARRILSSGNSSVKENYDQFFDDYASAIYRAWFLSIRPPDNDLFEIKLSGHGPSGGFGRIFEGIGRKGEKLAVKVLHQEVRDNPDMMEAFRRGVKAMQILSERGVDGMVAYIDAYEIPACAVMNFVDGPNVREATTAKLICSWSDIIEFSVQLSRIINDAHRLPERVLHRDIRPANIMLRDFYSKKSIDVVVLDFDLSWHQGAIGVSVENINSLSGFVAPEQIEKKLGFSTRNALVDSFGLGMTLFYVRSRQEPLFGHTNHIDWRNILTAMCDQNPCKGWKSLPRRFARTIEWATRYQQPERWDMAQILGELQRLQSALDNPNSVVDTELLSEELAARVDLGISYSWNQDKHMATFVTSAGISMAICADEKNRQLKLIVTWARRPRKIKKYTDRAIERGRKKLQKSGWTVNNVTSGDQMQLDAGTHSQGLAWKLDDHAKLLGEVFHVFSFD